MQNGTSCDKSKASQEMKDKAGNLIRVFLWVKQKGSDLHACLGYQPSAAEETQAPFKCRSDQFYSFPLQTSRRIALISQATDISCPLTPTTHEYKWCRKHIFYEWRPPLEHPVQSQRSKINRSVSYPVKLLCYDVNNHIKEIHAHKNLCCMWTSHLWWMGSGFNMIVLSKYFLCHLLRTYKFRSPFASTCDLWRYGVIYFSQL